MPNRRINDKAIGRLSLYRRFVLRRLAEGASHLCSHELANASGGTAAQVRQDLMLLGAMGGTARGYDAAKLADSIAEVLDSPEPEPVALVGAGNLGRAILAFFDGRRPALRIAAAFDTDPEKIGRVILGCRCHDLAQAPRVLGELGVRAAIVAVPTSAAQTAADMLVANGVRGILNFAPTPLCVPASVFVENVDLTTSLEKVAFFARGTLASQELQK